MALRKDKGERKALQIMSLGNIERVLALWASKPHNEAAGEAAAHPSTSSKREEESYPSLGYTAPICPRLVTQE